MLSTAILLTVWAAKALTPDSTCKLPVKIISLCAIGSFGFSVAYGHLNNGDSSVDQLLFGFLLAVWSFSFIHTMLMIPTIDHVRDLHQGKTLKPDLLVKRNFAIFMSTSTCVLLIGIAIYLVIVNTVTDESVWQVNVTNKCPDFIKSSTDLDRFYYDYSLASFGQVGYLIGAYCGIVFQYERFEGLSKMSPPKEKNCLKGFLRFLCLAGTAGPYTTILGFVPKFQNPFVWLFAQQLLSSLVLSFYLFGLADQILFKLGLYDKRDDNDEQAIGAEINSNSPL